MKKDKAGGISLENPEIINRGLELSPLNTDAEDNDDIEEVVVQVVEQKEERLAWDSKVQFLLSVIGYAVGLGNVWRFPYLCQQNGGGAFLIPYTIMLFSTGVPLFYLELGIGQHLRKGSIGVWNEISPYLGGVGISSTIVAFIVALYYNVIISWCLFYLGHSFHSKLPWTECPTTLIGNVSKPVPECDKSSATAYFWYREAIDISPSIEEPQGLKWRMTLCLIGAWFIVFICMMKGIKSSGKVIYFTATFPYIVLVIFFGRAVTLKGASAGLAHMFTPDMERLLDPKVWLDAGTQIFYSLGLGFGSLIAFASYNPPTNNCKRDALLVSFTNCGTSLFASLVIFSVLGFKATNIHEKCIADNFAKIAPYVNDSTAIYTADNITDTLYEETKQALSNVTLASLELKECNLHKELDEAAEGTGLAFIIFTQAIVELPGAPFWAVIFFLMLMTLGLGSMFGTLEGVLTSIYDMHLFTWMRKEVLTGIVCFAAVLIGLIFTAGSGEYWVKLFDSFGGTYALMTIALFEVIGVTYVYGWRRFSEDLVPMAGSKPGIYWLATWRFISPLFMCLILIASVVTTATRSISYKAYDANEANVVVAEYPWFAEVIIALLVLVGILPIPLVALLRYMKCVRVEADIPASVKHLNTTPSTAAMMNNMETDGGGGGEDLLALPPTGNGMLAAPPLTGSRAAVQELEGDGTATNTHHALNGIV